MSAFDGAIAGLNAARGDAPPIAMRTRDLDGFTDAFAQADGRADAERAAIDGMVRVFDPNNTHIPAAATRAAREEQPRAPVTWRIDDTAAIIAIPTFSETASAQVADALREIGSRPRPARIILDLRGNQGGLLDQIVATADHFIDGGPVAALRPFGDCARDQAETYSARGGDISNAAPLIILIDANTASGAELLAATLRERRGATLVGQTTFGNASVHTVVPLNSGDVLKLRTGTLTTPSGATWDAGGLTPDIVVPAEIDALAHALQ